MASLSDVQAALESTRLLRLHLSYAPCTLDFLPLKTLFRRLYENKEAFVLQNVM